MNRFVLTLVLASAVGGCTEPAKIIGNGHSQTQARRVSDFTRVQNRSVLAVTVTPGPTSVSITADSNLLPFITTEVDGGELVIDLSRGHLSSSLPLSASVTTPSLTGMDSQGAGMLTATGFDAGNFALNLSGAGAASFQGTVAALALASQGAGALRLVGSAAGLQATIDGAGSVDGTRFPVVGPAHVRLRGAGGASLRIQGDSDLEVDGAGSLTVALDGGTTNFTITGAGGIDWSGQTTVGQRVVSGPGSVQHR
jgi:hypothetical protein